MSTTCGYSGCRVDRVLRVDPASSIQRVQMTAFGATSLFTVAPSKVGKPPIRDRLSREEERPEWDRVILLPSAYLRWLIDYSHR
jgi:hypothetical protein